MAESITAAVGTPPAVNRAPDVETIQVLLNQVPALNGGPQPLLDVDGLIGPKTIGAIRKFQQTNLGFQDGRVDPNQKTLAKLNEFDKDPTIGNPVKFVEFQPFDGFDPPDPVRKAAAWQMVPLGGSKVVRIQGGGAARSVSVNNPSIARAVLLGDNAVQIFGQAHGTSMLKLRDGTGRVLARLDLSVKRKRTVKTSFFFVEDKANNKTVRTEAEIDPVIIAINKIWVNQANVEFTKKLVKPLKFNQDFGTEVRFTAHLPKTGPKAVAAKEHEWDLVVAKRDPGADFNVFFVTDYEDNVNPGDGPDAGTLAFQKSCLCDDQLGGHTLGLVLAHEAGHNMSLDHDTVAPKNLMGKAPTDADAKVHRRQIDRVNP